MIEVHHLRKEYGSTVAVEDVSFQVSKGEVLGLLGPNAAGKTTTMRMLTGFLPPTSGQARIAGHDVGEEPLEARRHIGYLPENVPLYDDMSVGQYLRFMARMRDVPGRQVADRVDTVMRSVGIRERERQAIGKLSRGLRQRVGIAQAMIHDPEVLILDEPTVGLDPRQVAEVREMIRGLGRDHTIILSTHILSEASMICDRIVILGEGRILAEDTPQALTSRLLEGQQVEVTVRGPGEEIHAALAALPSAAAVNQQRHASSAAEDAHLFLVQAHSGRDIREEIAGAIVRQGWGLLGLRQVSLSLEEIFLRMTTRSTLVSGNFGGRDARNAAS